MSTAVVGLGNIGSRLAKNLIAGGQRIIVADTTLAKAQKLAGELGGNAEAVPVADAIGKADVAILAIYFDAIKQLIATYRGALAEKIIVDPSNPIAPDARAASTRRSRRSNPRGSSFPPCCRVALNSSKRLGR
jgi:predicted dinucleotide-binding enzyme